MTISSFNKYLPRLSRRRYGILAIIGALLGLFVINAYLHSDGYLRKRLRSKLIRIDTITTSFTHLSDIVPGTEKTNQSNYRHALNAVLSDCRAVGSLTSSRPKAKDPLKTDLANSKRLCADLSKIIVYQANLYRFLDPLENAKTTNLPDLGTQPLKDYLVQTHDTITSTQGALKSLDNSFVNDPALAEITTLVNELARLSEAIKDPSDSSTVNELYAKMKTDQSDLLFRRAYFWNNTVHLEGLHDAIGKQIKAYK